MYRARTPPDRSAENELPKQGASRRTYHRQRCQKTLPQSDRTLRPGFITAAVEWLLGRFNLGPDAAHERAEPAVYPVQGRHVRPEHGHTAALGHTFLVTDDPRWPQRGQGGVLGNALLPSSKLR